MAVLTVVRCTMSIRSARFVVAPADIHGQGAAQPLVGAPANSKQLFPHQQLRRSFACSESSDAQLYAETKQNHCHWSSHALGAAGAVAGSVGAATQCAPGPGKEYWCMVCGEPNKQNRNAYVGWVCNAWQRLDRSNHHHGKSERRGNKRQDEDLLTQGTLTRARQQAIEATQQVYLQAMAAALAEKDQSCFWRSCRCAGLLD